ncbi:acetate kinase [Actinokineospora bangkokensis]|uniref:Acetate kinase n=1 Tax=Actinokineospora bangkokensis TaxID=1193682 RepID=A0A1Q9LM32_9PSEU|nr:acetate kinase [Actinokineospora bangkokensis]
MVGVILTVNTGSGSVKADLVDDDRVVDSAHLETTDADEAWAALRGLLDDRRVDAVAHRLVHGGSRLTGPAVADDEALAAARSAASLAPLHVPPALEFLEQLRDRLPGVPQVLCPDTAFHRDLPEHAATYALPQQWRERFGLRRYGFHGLSYSWALPRAAELLGTPEGELSVVMAHLGGGSSVCAVRDGRSVDTSMGFTPLDGVPMAKRSGAVDPGMLLWLQREAGLSLAEVEDGLNHASGLLGLSGGESDDTRDLVASGSPGAALALGVFAHRVRREVAACATNLDRLDALVFTGEIGWDQPEVRAAVTGGLRLLGVAATAAPNSPTDAVLTPPGGGVPVLVVEPREELALARAARTCLG